MCLVVCLDVSKFMKVFWVPLLSLGVGFLIELSRYTSKTTSKRWLSVPSFKTMYIKLSATSANVFWSPFMFWTIAIPSKIRTRGCGIMSAAVMFFWSSLASDALLVFLSDPSAEARAQGSGARGWHSTSFIFNFLFSAIMIMWANNARSALMITSLLVPLCTFIFFERSPIVVSLSFVILSWNFTLGGSDSSRFLQKCLKASSPKAPRLKQIFLYLRSCELASG